MSSERTRSAPLLVPEEDVARVIRRAAELERARAPGASGALTLDELETIARDAGLDPALVREAARELAAGGPRRASPFLGAATTQVIERVVDVEPTPEVEGMLVQAARTLLSPSRRDRPVHVERVGRLTTVTGSVQKSAIQVEILPGPGRTTLRLRSDGRALAGGLFGGLMGGLGGGLGAHAAWMLPVLLHLPVVAGVAGAAGALAGAWVLARTIFGVQRRAADRTLRELADRLEALLTGG